MRHWWIAASRPAVLCSVFGALGFGDGSLSKPYFSANSFVVSPLCSIAALQTAAVLSRSPFEALSPAARRAAYFSRHSFTTPDAESSVFGDAGDDEAGS